MESMGILRIEERVVLWVLAALGSDILSAWGLLS